jgi:hypothetical protein
MWQYTTETIINSNKGKLKQIDSATNKLLTGKTDADLVRFYKDSNNTVYIEGVGVFKSASIKNVWKRPYQKAIPASGELTVPAATSGKIYRLQVWVSEEGTIRPELQNAMLMKSLPFQFEVEKGTEALEVTLEKAIKKIFAKKGADRLFDAKAASGKLVLTASDCYVRFDEVRLDEVPSGEEDLTGYKNYKAVENAKWTEVNRGTEGNGTVARLVKNMRIPTKTSLDPFGADQGGKPVPGGEYDQYMFEYITERSHVGHQVMGSVGDQSLTTHVFFVMKGDTSDAFNGLFTNVEVYQPNADENKSEQEIPVAPEGKEEVFAKPGKGAKK